MTLNLTIPQNQHTDFTPRITVVGVGGGGSTMRGPAGVADAGFARQGFMHQQIGQVHQLANRATAVQLACVHRGDACGIVAAIFQPL